MIEFESVLSLILATVLGAIVGIEREITKKPAGLRTHMLVSLGSCLFTIVSVHNFSSDPARVAASIVTGMGFIGAGAIIAERGRVVGVTTAASLWVTGSIGLCTGTGNYLLSIAATIIIFLVLFSKKMLRKERKSD